MDLTNGSIFKKLVIYAIPFIFTNILQILFNAADIAVVGVFVNDDAVAAVGANSSFNNLLIGFFVGLSIGSNIVLARYVGAKDLEGARKTVGTSILIALCAGTLLMVIGIPLAETFLRLMACDEKILPMAATYLRIYFLGMPIMMLYNFCASILRAVGDTRRPLIYLTIGGVVNVGLNVFFVLVLNMTVEGVAIATIASQTIASILSLIALFKGNGYGSLKIKYLKFYKEQLKSILILGVPSGLQSTVFNISNVLIQSTVNSFGMVGMSANTTAQQFDSIVYNVGNAVSMSTMSFVGQNIGAKRMDRVKRTIIDGAILIFLIQFGVGGLFTIFAPQLCGIIANSPEVIAWAVVRLTIMGLTYFICGEMEVCANSVRAMGKPIVSLIISVCGASVFRILFLEITFAIWPYFNTIFWSYAASWTFTTIVYWIVVPMVFKSVKRKIQEQSTLKAPN
jgi:putative MATE family efflux protein